MQGPYNNIYIYNPIVGQRSYTYFINNGNGQYQNYVRPWKWLALFFLSKSVREMDVSECYPSTSGEWLLHLRVYTGI